MVSRWRNAIVIAFVMVFSGSTAFAEDQSAFYAGLRLVGSAAEIDDVETSGFGGPFVDRHSSDLAGGVGGVLGYRWGALPVRTEMEVAHRFRFDWDFRDGTSPPVGYQNNVQSTNVLFNILLELRNRTDFTPFFGGTIGWARNRTEVERSVNGSGVSTSQTNSENNFAWGAMAGLEWAFARHWGIELAYRYINLGSVGTGLFPTGEKVTADDYTSHDVLLSGMFKW